MKIIVFFIPACFCSIASTFLLIHALFEQAKISIPAAQVQRILLEIIGRSDLMNAGYNGGYTILY